MATSSNFNTKAYKHEGTNDERYLIFSWMVKSQNVQENKTVIEWTLEGGGGKDTSTYLTQNITVKIGDVVVYDFPKSKGQIALRKGTVVASGTHTITHTADGSKTFTVYVAAGIYEWGVNSTGTKEFVLPQIPRASKITAAEETVLGTACNIQWTPASAEYKYELQFKLGYSTVVLDDIKPNTTNPYTYTGYVLPLELAEEITAAKSAEVDVTLFTYNSKGEQIGEAQEAKLVVTVPEESTKPSIDITEIKPVPAQGNTVSDVYVQGKSKVQVIYEASGQYGATVTSKSVSIGGNVIEGDTSDYLSEYGKVEITVTAVDSRGISNTVTHEITVLPYTKPKLTPVDGYTEVICTRCDANGTKDDAGEYLSVKATANISELKVDDVAHNSGALWYRWKLASKPDSAYSSKSELIGNATGKNLFDYTQPKVSGASNIVSQEDGVIEVQQNGKQTWCSANMELPTCYDLVGETITITCKVKTSGVNNAALRVMWLTEAGGATGQSILSSAVASDEYTNIKITGVIPAQPAETHPILGILLYSNRDASIGSGAHTAWFKDIQIEIGSTATEYEPYKPQTDTYDGVIDAKEFDKAASYTVQIGVSDDVGESAFMTFTIFSEEVFWHRGRYFLALGMHTDKGGLEVKWPARFYGDVHIFDEASNELLTLADYIRKIIEGG